MIIHKKLRRSILKMKKVISVILLLAMTLAIVACNKGGQGETGTKAPVGTGGAERLDSLPDDLDFNGAAVRILYPEEIVDEFYFEDGAGSSEVVDVAVYETNLAVMERLAVEYKMETLPGYEAKNRASYENRIKNAYAANEDLWDLITCPTYHIPPVVSSGALVDLHGVEYLDFTKPYWLASLLEDSEVNGRIYFAAGDASLSLLKNTMCMIFNKELAAQLIDGDIQQVAFDGKWTKELLKQYAVAAYQGVDPSNPNIETDTFGFGIQNYNHLSAFGPAFGIRILTRNNDGSYSFGYTESTVADKVAWLCDLFHGNPGFVTGDNNGSMDVPVSTSFKAGQMLFSTTTLDNMAGLYAEINGDYSILPYPKWDEEQEGYYTFARNIYMSFGVTRTTPNASMAGAVLECIASESAQRITPAFFEDAMKVKFTEATPTVKGLFDQIRAGVVLDIGFTYAYILGIDHLMDNAIKDNDTGWVSTVAANRISVQKKIQEYVAKLNALEGEDS